MRTILDKNTVYHQFIFSQFEPDDLYKLLGVMSLEKPLEKTDKNLEKNPQKNSNDHSK